MGTLVQDVKYGLRMLAKKPGFTAVAVLTLALGIGANTAIFSVIDASLLRPLPYQHSERLVNLTMRFRRGSRFVVAPHFVAWRGQSRVLILSAGVWRQNFGGNPDVIGKTVNLDGTPYTVVGVMPAGLVYPPGEAWVPEVLDATNSLPSSPDFPLLTVIGRLKTATSIEQARSELQLVTDRFNKQVTPSGRAHAFSQARVEVVPLHALRVGDVRALLFILLAAVSFVLLIASANVANLLLVRAAGRAREVAIRAAL